MADNEADEGRFIAFLSAKHDQGDKRPAFEGILTAPGGREERRAALWVRTTKTGKTMLSGRVSRSTMEQIEDLAQPPQDKGLDEAQSDGAQFAVDAQEIMLFPNGQKSDADSKLPDYWGYCNPGKGKPLLRLAVWATTDRNGKAMLTGSATVHAPAKDAGRAPAPPGPGDVNGRTSLHAPSAPPRPLRRRPRIVRPHG